MNEQIRELAKEAGANISTRNLMSNPPQHVETVELWDDKIEKFAELIVKECVTTLERHHPFTKDPEAYLYAISLIEYHFGVE
jgi:actin-like ATPase involved in cell morphogenesis